MNCTKLLSTMCIGIVCAAPSSVALCNPLSIALTADTVGHVGPCFNCPGKKGLGGLERRVTLVKQFREKQPDLLLLDAGNALIGDESLASNGEVIIAAYNELGYDAVNITHHDFYRGKETTLAVLKKAKFDPLSANVLDEETGKPLLKPYIVRKFAGESVAVIGVTQRPAVLDIPKPLPPALQGQLEQFKGIHIGKPKKALAEWLPEITTKADRVILLYHGSQFELSEIRDEFSAQIDVIGVGGIRPKALPKDAQPPVIASSMHGRHLAFAHLSGKGGDVKAKVEQIAVSPKLKPDAQMHKLLAKYVDLPDPPIIVAKKPSQKPKDGSDNGSKKSDKGKTDTVSGSGSKKSSTNGTKKNSGVDKKALQVVHTFFKGTKHEDVNLLMSVSETPFYTHSQQKTARIESNDKLSQAFKAVLAQEDYGDLTYDVGPTVSYEKVRPHENIRPDFIKTLVQEKGRIFVAEVQTRPRKKSDVVLFVTVHDDKAKLRGIMLDEKGIARKFLETFVQAVESDSKKPPTKGNNKKSDSDQSDRQVVHTFFKGTKHGDVDLLLSVSKTPFYSYSQDKTIRIDDADKLRKSFQAILAADDYSNITFTIGPTVSYEKVCPHGNIRPTFIKTLVQGQGTVFFVDVRMGPGKKQELILFVTIADGTAKLRGIAVDDKGTGRKQLEKLTQKLKSNSGVAVELPEDRGVYLAFGGFEHKFELVQGKKVFPLKIDPAQSAPVWVPIEGQASLRSTIGEKSFETPIKLKKGRINKIPFDAEVLAKRHELCLFQVDLPSPLAGGKTLPAQTLTMDDFKDGTLFSAVAEFPPDQAFSVKLIWDAENRRFIRKMDADPDQGLYVTKQKGLELTLVHEDKEKKLSTVFQGKIDPHTGTLRGTMKEKWKVRVRTGTLSLAPGFKSSVIVMDKSGEMVMALKALPSAYEKWLCLPHSVVRLQKEGQEVIHRNLPVGKLVTLKFDSSSSNPKKSDPKVLVDIVIEEPENGTTVKGDTVKLVGRASTAGPAGATRVVVIIDVSGSVKDSSGADLDDDGTEENILEAEVAAVRLLLDELVRLEKKGPGTAFETAIIRFSSNAQEMVPLMPLTDPKGVASLHEALDQVASDGYGGSTNFVAALETAQKTFRASERPGPAIIIFVTDGIPRDTKSSLDAAGRFGLESAVIHTIGLGQAFQGDLKPGGIVFPPIPEVGVEILGFMASVGAPGSTMTPLPKPSDVVKVVSRLPVLELPEADLKEVLVRNLTTDEPALKVDLHKDGSFEAIVPVSLVPDGKFDRNLLQATAVAKSSDRASDRVTVRGERKRGRLEIVSPKKKLPSDLLPAVELVLDSSGSMLKIIDNRRKTEIAGEVMAKVLKRLPDGIRVGLRLYGHLGFWHRPGAPRAGSPADDDPRWYTDTKLEVPIGKLDKERRQKIHKFLEWAEPRGMTPLVYSLLKAQKDFPQAWEGPKIVVLVSDGKETCGGNLVDVANAYRQADIIIHTVGFDIDDPKLVDKITLQRLAQFGGGKYYTAKDAKQLVKALEAAVRSPGYVIYDEAGKKVEQLVLNGGPVELAPGRYRIKLVGSDQEPLLINVTGDEPLRLSVDEKGKLITPAENAGSASN